MSIVVVLLLLPLLLDSCNARILKVSQNEEAREYFQHSKENIDEKVGGFSSEVEMRRRKEEERVMDDDFGGSNTKWKVPHDLKAGGEEAAAGFNLDYLPPKTHPPLHN